MPPRHEQHRRLSAKDILGALKSFGFDVVATRGSHAKLSRVTEDAERETLTVPLHKKLDLGTIQAVYRQAARFIPEAELRPWFYGE